MDRQIVYPGQILPETSLLQMAKDSMIGAAKLASALLGTNTYASGFAVTPTGPASLQVVYAPGEIYSLTAIDVLAFSSLPADTTHSILKQGILLDGGTLNCPAPGTTGQSINYLVQVTYQDVDSAPVLLPYYNSANPALPYSGMGNNGLTQNTIRKGAAVVTVKAGASAVTGTQVTPSPDVGYVGLYVVTVAFGQTTITAGSIALAAAAPLINSTLHGLSPVFTAPPVVPPATLASHAVQLGQIAAVVGNARNVRIGVATASATATCTADEIIVKSALGGNAWQLSAFSKTINLATTGAGGMDTGTAPTSGFVGLYAIYNPTTATSALLAVNATSSAAPNIYGGANMPAGYTASALVSVWPTNGSGLFAQGYQADRDVYVVRQSVLNTSVQQASLTPIAIAGAVPINAKEVSGDIQITSTTTATLVTGLSGASVAIGGIFQQVISVGAQESYKIPLVTAQIINYQATASAGTMNLTIYVSGYSF
ncbi:hypothetical protein ACW582_16010 [Pseudomonas chlororaphis]